MKINSKWVLGGLAVLTLLIISRFSLAPVIDLTIDDWALLASVSDKSLVDVFKFAALDIYRPAVMILAYVTTHMLGDNAIGYAIIKFAGAIALIVSVIALAYASSGHAGIAFLAGALFTVLPITHEPFGYAIQSLLLVTQSFLFASLAAWEMYLRNGKKVCLVLSVLFYLPIAGWEFGVFSAPYFIIRAMLANAGRRALIAGTVFLGLASVYLAWRFTSAFGFGHHTMFDSRYLGGSEFNVMTIIQNIRRIASWWIGGLMLDTNSAGWASFRQIIPKYQLLLVLIMTGALALLVYAVRALSAICSNPIPARRYVISLLLFTLFVYVPFLIFPAVPRHNIFPAAALSIVFAHFVVSAQGRERLVTAALVIGLFGLSSAGLSKNWRDSGLYHRNTYQYLQSNKDQWSSADYMLVDTSDLQQRLTPGIHELPNEWAVHGGANLPRAWVYSSMMKLIHSARYPDVILDAESDACWENDVLHWHRRFDPTTRFQANAQTVYTLNSLKAGTSNSSGLIPQ